MCSCYATCLACVQPRLVNGKNKKSGMESRQTQRSLLLCDDKTNEYSCVDGTTGSPLRHLENTERENREYTGTRDYAYSRILVNNVINSRTSDGSNLDYTRIREHLYT